MAHTSRVPEIRDQLDRRLDPLCSLVGSLKEIVFQTDANGCWTFLNRAWEDITGFSVAESLGVPFQDYIHPDERAKNQVDHQALVEGKRDLCRHEVRFLTKSGGFRWLEVHVRQALDASGKVVGTLGTLCDMTARSEAQESLRQQAAILEAVNDAAHGFLLAGGWRGKIDAVLSNLGHAAGISRIYVLENGTGAVGEVAGTRRHEWTTGAEADASQSKPAAIPYALMGPDQWIELLRSGEPVWGDGADFFAAFGVKSRLLVPIFANQRWWGSIGVDDCRCERKWPPAKVGALQAAAGILGAAIHREQTEAALRDAHDELELRVRERTAELETLNRALRMEIVERQKAEQALTHREHYFRALIDNTRDVMFVADAEGIIRYVSSSVTRVFQYEPAELIGRAGFEFVQEGDLLAVTARFREGLGLDGTHEPFEARIRQKDGSWRVAELVGNNQMANPAVQGIIVTLRDITERKRLEEQFRQAQKMEAVGRLAGGVAHDFNNLLTVIRGYGDLCTRQLPPDSPAKRQLGQIRLAADRAVALVQQLTAFSRKQVVEPRILNLNTAIADLEKMLGRMIGEDIQLTITKPTEPLHVRIDPTQLEQIVINLCVNARDAMPQGGTLTIATAVHEKQSKADCPGCRVATGNWAVIEVRDTGTGISDEARAHIFEPFFTTKEVGKGTGLGLSMVYGATEQAGGHICVTSTPGQGTMFRICLPLVESSATPASERSYHIEPQRGSEAILLVEDEELVRVMIRDSLLEAGYQVLEARQGDQALRILENREGLVHLLLTDIVMPRMSGPELAEKVVEMRPGIRVLYISGYPRKELSAGSAFLRKPFTPDELIRDVRKVLDR